MWGSGWVFSRSVGPWHQQRHLCGDRIKPCSLIGSELKVPGWLARSIALESSGVTSSCRVDAASVMCSRWMSRLEVIWSAKAL